MTVYTVHEAMDHEYDNLVLATADEAIAFEAYQRLLKKLNYGEEYGYPDLGEEYTAENKYTIRTVFRLDDMSVELLIWKEDADSVILSSLK